MYKLLIREMMTSLYEEWNILESRCRSLVLDRTWKCLGVDPIKVRPILGPRRQGSRHIVFLWSLVFDAATLFHYLVPDSAQSGPYPGSNVLPREFTCICRIWG